MTLKSKSQKKNHLCFTIIFFRNKTLKWKIIKNKLESTQFDLVTCKFEGSLADARELAVI